MDLVLCVKNFVQLGKQYHVYKSVTYRQPIVDVSIWSIFSQYFPKMKQ